MNVKVLTLIIALCFSACSGISQKPHRSETLIPKLPFKVSIVDEINDGETLFVRSKIEAFTAWNASEVFVRLKGLSNGVVEESLITSLREAIEGQQPQNGNKFIARRFDNLFLEFSLPSKNLDSYQFELVWGKEAKEALLAKTEKDLVVLSQVRLDFEPADCEGCSSVPVVEALLNNDSDKAVMSITIELSIKVRSEEEDDQVARIKVIEIADLGLPPGAEQTIELELGALEKGIMADQLEVRARILSYELDSE